MVGASSGVFIALAVAVGQGDSAIVEHPSYDPLNKAADFLGVRVTDLLRRADAGFAVPLETLKTGLSRGARAVVLTNLHNPSGQSLAEETIHHIADCCAASDATLIVDEVYLDGSHLVTGRRPWTAANLGDNVIAINSLTKVFGLGGLPPLAERGAAGARLRQPRSPVRVCPLAPRRLGRWAR